MLRIWFTGADLARVRVPPGPDARWEAAISLAALHSPGDDASIAYWCRLAGTERAGAAGDVEEAGNSGDTRAAGEAQDAGNTGDAEALRLHHDTALAPHWPAVKARLAADLAARVRIFLDAGGEGLLRSLQPWARWRPPVLEVDHPADDELQLAGRGLVLTPSAQCPRPVAVLAADGQPVLIYPIGPAAPAAGTAAAAGAVDDPLSGLLGVTRAAALRGIGAGCSTSDLARRLDVSLATASYHLSVLRAAGLVLTLRDGGAVLHTQTPLAQALITGDPQDPAARRPAGGISGPAGR